MENKHSFKLIKGNFDATEAGKVVFALINSKINYHSLDVFSNQIRFNQQLTASEKRIEELKSANSAIRSILKYAAEKGLRVEINSSIEINLVGHDEKKEIKKTIKVDLENQLAS